MSFNAQDCYYAAQNSYNENMEKKYAFLVQKVKTVANRGYFGITVDDMSAECCKWLMQQGFKISVYKPSTINGKQDWHWVSETYYDRDLADYGKAFGIKINWKL